ncbi:MAG: AmmeMemoRadiSam system protein B [Treponema sp.]|nr:AmmeMemoRadiSam system protein B [Treponema sp.]
MNLRDSCLPAGWYPRDPGEIKRFLGAFSEESRNSPAVIAPHAGWFYSGRTAARALSALDREADTIAVIGGHLPKGASFLFACEQGVKTPLGAMMIDSELQESFGKQLGWKPDLYQDNTVEVLLPMIRYFFPNAKLLWVRFPASFESYQAGGILAETAGKLGRRVAAVGSTDLTHYGDSYGFAPAGRGKEALAWMRDENDAAFIKAVLSGDPRAVLRRAAEDSSACSAGAVLGAMGFASAAGAGTAELLDYRTSADAMEGETPASFVGYAAIAF